ncbi:MAG: phage terminase small subunit P27 family [Psychrilyobacter sp.]|uniref:phage terminase small subunit P27 family n=1 Tax=Psychrilyobacter sp. TaxID=2586924 RepID=UPI003C74B986
MPPKKQVGAQTRHNTKSEIAKKKLEEESTFVGNDQLQNPPRWLINQDAVEEWKRLVNEFGKKSLISNLDYNNLGLYCNSFIRYKGICTLLNKQGVMLLRDPNPLVALEIKYSDEIKKYSALLGLTSESRLNLGSNKINNEEQNVEGTFGDI